jgi:hypothetical protein
MKQFSDLSPRKIIKCPWCGRMIRISAKGNLCNHIVSPKVQCVGNGQPVASILEWEKLRNENLPSKSI